MEGRIEVETTELCVLNPWLHLSYLGTSTSVAVVKGLILFAVATAEEIFLTQSGEHWQARVQLTVGDIWYCQRFCHVTSSHPQVSSNLGPRGGKGTLVRGNAEMDLPQEDRYQWRVFLCHVPLLPPM